MPDPVSAVTPLVDYSPHRGRDNKADQRDGEKQKHVRGDFRQNRFVDLLQQRPVFS